MGLGWLGSLLVLGWLMPVNRDFVDQLLLGLVLLAVIPALVGAFLGVFLAALFRWAWRDLLGVNEVWHARLRNLSIVAGVLVALLVVVSFLMPPKRLHTRLLVYGVDGATWAVIDTLRPLSMMPNFDRLEKEGSSGVLRSIEPMLSPIVWTTIGSGQPLDRHGIHGFHVKNDECKVARFWDVLESRENVVGTYKWLVTYPPREIDGFMVPGWLATGPEMVPRDLEYTRLFEQSRRARHRGEEAGGKPVGTVRYVLYGVRDGLKLSTLAASVRLSLAGRYGTADEVAAMTDVHMLRALIDRDLFFGLMERYDPAVATFTYYPTDAVAHRAWRYFEPDHFGGVDERSRELWDTIPSTYRQADTILADIRKRLPPDAYLLVLSDHGMTAAGGEGGVAVYGLRGGVVDESLEQRGAIVDVAQVGMKVTVAVAADSPLDASAVRSLFRGFRFAGGPLFEVEDLSGGVFGLTLAPEGDLQARSDEPVTLPGGDTVPLQTFLRLRADYSGVHHEEGVIYLAGPDIRQGVRIADSDLYDVAPTILAMMGIPQAEDMVGEVIGEAFEQPPVLRDGPASYNDLLARHVFVDTDSGGAAGDAGDAALEQRLQALGYVDTPSVAPTPPDEGAAPTPGETP